MIKINDIEQGSAEWMALRIGVPSSSRFSEIVKANGKQSDSRKKYMYQLAGERIAQRKEASYTNKNMQNGIDTEEEARNYYELHTNDDVETVGFCYKDEEKLFGCSPDGLVGDDGGVEIKCVIMSTQVSYLLSGKLPTTYFQQVQGSLYITGRKWWDFLSYCPGMKPFLVRVTPDVEFIAALDYELRLFTKELDILTEKIR